MQEYCREIRADCATATWYHACLQDHGLKRPDRHHNQAAAVFHAWLCSDNNHQWSMSLLDRRPLDQADDLTPRQLCFGGQYAHPHLAMAVCCLANIWAKISSALCPSWSRSWAYRINACMSAWACWRHASPMVLRGALPCVGDKGR